MPKVLVLAKTFSIVLTAATASLLENPICFFTRVYRRFMGSKRFNALGTIISKLEGLGAVSRLETKLNTSVEILSSKSLPIITDQPHVLFFLNNSEPYTKSGYTERTKNLLRGLRRQDVCVVAATRLGYPAVVGRIPRATVDTVNGLTYHRILPWSIPFVRDRRVKKAVSLLKRLALDKKISIIHTTTPFTNAEIVSTVASELGIPWIYEVRGEPEKTWLSNVPVAQKESARESNFFKLSQERETVAMQSAAKVIALSEVSKSSLIERGVDAEKISVIPNSVERTRTESELTLIKEAGLLIRRRLGLSGKKILGTVTSVVGYEGLDTLIRSLKFLEEEWHVLIVGDGDEKTNLQDLSENLGLDSKVTFVGRQDSERIEAWYSAIDVFVIPRRDELVCRTVTPIKPLTALSLWIPIVASDLPALREVTGNFAFYFDPQDPQQLAARVDEAFASSYPSKAEAWLEKRTWNTTASALRNIYTLGRPF